MNATKYWTWHMGAGVILLFLLGSHMLSDDGRQPSPGPSDWTAKQP